MNLRKNFLAHAVACAVAGIAAPVLSQETSKSLAPVIVTADPFGASESAMILAPAKVLSGNELRNKMGGSLGDTLGTELGVNASGFSTGSSRPIIRGLEGPRVKILQNGMNSGDLSAISNDHAVGSGMMSAQQIEILRGPAALLYGSGAIGGLVNIVNGRIPTTLEPRATGESELRYSTVDQGAGLSFSADRSAGNIGLHVDGSVMNAGDYRIPGNSSVGGTSDNNSVGKLSFSRNRQDNIAVGGSLIQDWGFIGASVAQLNKVYGIHGHDLAKIDLTQTRFDVDSFVKSPFQGFDGLRVKLGQTDYRHTELDDGTDPHVRFGNKAFESRWELSHLPIAGWRGKLGLQTDHANVQALSADGDAPTVPRTRSQSTAAFLVEERDFGDVRFNVGGRVESVSRRPVAGTARSFSLGSVSAGALWSFMPGYGLGSTLSLAQRAPTAEELYSNGAHHPTETYDIGTGTLRKETSTNIDLSLQKTQDKLRWRTNVFQNKVKNFVYGSMGGDICEDGTSAAGCTDEILTQRTWSQADATLRGIEAELSYNFYDTGWFGRVFADKTRGTLDNLGNLPLQPAARTGLSFGYQDAQWRSSLSVLHADRHTRIASSSISEETPTSSYTRVDASINYVQRYGTTDVTWFLLARNLLNEEIRLSTSLLKEYVPQPGRNFIVGLRARF
jgi:iron complex outermembrane receptor protein